MIFRPELAKLIVEGKKTATRRLVSDNPRSPWAEESDFYPVGKVFAVNPGRGITRVAECEVTGRRIERLYEATDADGRREGFPRRVDFLAAFLSINRGCGLRCRVHVVEFELRDVWAGSIERLDALLAPK